MTKKGEKIISKYLHEVEKMLVSKSEMLRISYTKHGPSIGKEHEKLVIDFLEKHLPKKYGVSTGFVVTNDGTISKELDILITDRFCNAPFHAGLEKPIWTIESVFVGFEVKTNLRLNEIRDAIRVCKDFKNMERNFFNEKVPINTPRKESLFVLFSFDQKTSEETIMKNIHEEIRKNNLSAHDIPDFIVIPGRLVMHSGDYGLLAIFGDKNSTHRSASGYTDQDVEDYIKNPQYRTYKTGSGCFLRFFIWLKSWIRFAGERTTDELKLVE